MSFFSQLFTRGKTETVVLIDVSADSIGGAYAVLSPNVPPVLHHVVRVPIAPSAEPILKNMEDALADVLHDLVQKGAPAVRSKRESAHPDRVLVSVAPPWQETLVRTEHLEEKEGTAFVFTHARMQDALHRAPERSAGSVLSEEIVAAIMLNGYETSNPFGKRVKHADLVILSSYMAAETQESIRISISGAFHIRTPRFASSVSVAHTVLRDVFPHEHDALVLAISGEAADLVLIKHDIPRDIVSIPVRLNALQDAKRAHGITETNVGDEAFDTATDKPDTGISVERMQHAKNRWLIGITEALRFIHKRSPLPNTIFLIADTAYREFAKGLLSTTSLHSLWLSDRPLTVLPIEPSHLASFIRVEEDATNDLFLTLLALYAKKKGP